MLSDERRVQVNGAGKCKMPKHSFPPIVTPDARLLILGTLPGDESLRLQQYYGHPRNHFWPLISAVFGETAPHGYAERVALIKRNRCALWDVLECAERDGSSDAAIQAPIANPFGAFFADYPNIMTIAFNGQTARNLFRRYVVKPGLVSEQALTMLDLPSSSPLYTKPLQEKLVIWRAVLPVETLV
jgi:hypoxanthine-DNA glycosylase